MTSVSDTVDVELLGQRIRLVRADRGMTLADVARETGLSTGFLSQVENGLTNVSLSALYRIAGALTITAPELLVQGAEPIVSVVRRGRGSVEECRRRGTPAACSDAHVDSTPTDGGP